MTHSVLNSGARFRQPRGLDHDVGALEAILPIVGDGDLLAEIRFEPFREGIAAFRAAGMHADLIEIEEVVEKADIPVRGAAGADMAEQLASLRARYFAPSAVTAPVRMSVIAVASRMAFGTPVFGIEQVEDRHLGGQTDACSCRRSRRRL